MHVLFPEGVYTSKLGRLDEDIERKEAEIKGEV